MHKPDRFAVFHYEQTGNAQRVHDFDRFRCQHCRLNDLGRAGHNLPGTPCQQVLAHMPAKIAIGDDADERACVIDNPKTAKTPVGHQNQGLIHGLVHGRKRQAFRSMHHFANLAQHGAKLAAGMEYLEIPRGKAALLQQGDGKRVAQRELQRGRGGRGKSIGAGLLRIGEQQQVRGGLRQRTGFAGRYGDDRNIKAQGIIDQRVKLGGFSGFGERKDDIVHGDHAQIAMACLGGMDELGWRARGGQGGSDFTGYMAAFAHAGDNNPAFHLVEARDGLHEGLIQAVTQSREPRHLDIKRLTGADKSAISHGLLCGRGHGDV